ncbi:hypothetical protein BaRGS_00024684 [Batillaria attramentaria]|uniref:Selenoprotein H n=1 Tax=Batillaria attramentaria TaxID=370345 RepID=A0ABD0KAG4_9CAEN
MAVRQFTTESEETTNGHSFLLHESGESGNLADLKSPEILAGNYDINEDGDEAQARTESERRGRCCGGIIKRCAVQTSKTKFAQKRLQVQAFCRILVFRRKAEALSADLVKEFGDMDVSLNPVQPRRGSFEITLNPDSKNPVLVWSGLKKGPPRKLKFPESEVVIKEIKAHL